jgi:stearoyl-CoA desaturase (Delta-9 desaturase)
MSVNRLYYLWVLLGLMIPAVVGGVLLRSWYGVLDGLIWGGLIRMFAVHQIIYWLTSFAHVVGTRDFQCSDLSTNSAVMALPTLGEAWHNNHHAFPRAAVLSFRWWQLDITGMFIRLLEASGAAWDVHRPSREDLQRRRKIKVATVN